MRPNIQCAGGEVLMVDDSVDDVELAVTVLSSYWPADRIAVVHDGAEAGDYLYRRGRYANREPGHPVLILLDIKMPKVDGLELLLVLKSDEFLKPIPVVMLTSSREERDVRASYRLGTNAYVVKPLVFAEFQDTLRRLGAFWLSANEMTEPGT
ncbi:MAG: response regulator [Betaproteobacteria bacterium]|nr:response regulator [Betaproteobacteria bacterium]